ncbi:MAG: dienelactone hydrolase family protein [Desulfovermiculus sp.]
MQQKIILSNIDKIIHDWDGLGEYEKKRAEMLAGEGYAVFAADLYGQGIRPTTLEDKKARSGALYSDRDEMRARILILHGSRDEVAPMTDVADLATALDNDRVEFRMDIFGGARHAFTVWSGDRYSGQADQASWSALKAFLSQQLR